MIPAVSEAWDMKLGRRPKLATHRMLEAIKRRDAGYVRLRAVTWPPSKCCKGTEPNRARPRAYRLAVAKLVTPRADGMLGMERFLECRNRKEIPTLPRRLRRYT